MPPKAAAAARRFPLLPCEDLDLTDGIFLHPDCIPSGSDGGQMAGNFTRAEEVGLVPCDEVEGLPPTITCLGETRQPACDTVTGLWVLGTTALPEELIVDSVRTGFDNPIGNCDVPWDCDDTANLRCDRTNEICDGVDNNCNDAANLGFNRDNNRNGLPDLMEDMEIPGFVDAREVDFDGDNELECLTGSPLGAAGSAVTYRGNEIYVTPGDDCNNQCVDLFNEVALEGCTGFALGQCGLEVGSLEGVEIGNGAYDVDRDRDGYRTCGAFSTEDTSLPFEYIYTLVYATDVTDYDVPASVDPTILWDIVPLILPREQKTGSGGPTGEPMVCDTALHDKLNDLTGDSNVLLNRLESDGSYDYSSLLQACVEADTCRELRARGETRRPDWVDEDRPPIGDRDTDTGTDTGVGTEAPDEEFDGLLPPYCYEHRDSRCVIARLTIGSEADAGLFDTEVPGCLEDAEGGVWAPEQAITRSIWSKERIVEARRLVVDWECYRNTGSFGCEGTTVLTKPDDWDSVYAPIPRPGGLIADRDWLSLESRYLSSNPEFDLMFNRYGPVPMSDGLYMGCWGDPSRAAGLLQFDHVGGDCNDDRDLGGLGANRGGYEGPGDLLGVFDGEVVDCSVCTDGIDNNCNGLPDCGEPACARCFVGQGVGCGADTCSSGGCASQARGGKLTGTGTGLLFLMMFGMGWRRRSEA